MSDSRPPAPNADLEQDLALDFVHVVEEAAIADQGWDKRVSSVLERVTETMRARSVAAH